ncbi:molybdenum cofactor guanylyltransferase MobA [Sinorhizobium terangae]|uniref:Molybdenum cofactor guanylyltransferase n=1 Tax=Sinorhizobium terangae TaxID=110322 RepID=A0A6N7LGP0_SINTE|nr:molybdenum cofactor guanylyltransferase MobA [Sinorhizobium terangae]MBB4187552.1 molybdopterin-guanine dinucleotide biosynthesis protein A [Sinorhizobium terangae]MQX16942.1 molybdenum cofactor guanylyltransferase MobA [Sinorhizobium terangae]WFU49315.1 molybdenum cofactor guanylyltransferase MobA [Sinorhizobium terangae]
MATNAPETPTRPPAVILAGGRSMRMGRPKAGLVLDGRPILDHIVERLAPQVGSIALNLNADPGITLPPGLAVLADTVPGYFGPLAGILTAMRHAAEVAPHAPHVLTVATDTPFFPDDLVGRLSSIPDLEGTIAVAWSDGEMHPLFALWPVAIADDLEAWIRTDAKLRVRAFIARHPSAAVDFPMIATKAGPLDPFFNINTPDELQQAESWLQRLKDPKP